VFHLIRLYLLARENVSRSLTGIRSDGHNFQCILVSRQLQQAYTGISDTSKYLKFETEIKLDAI